MVPLKIKFAKCKDNAIIPTRKYGDAGLDLYVAFDEDKEYEIINPGETKNLPTGIKSIIHPDYYIQIEERGSSGSLGIKYSAGVIDSSYRGEWFLTVTNLSGKILFVHKPNIELPYDKYTKENTIFWNTNKALFQGVIHSVHNEVSIDEVVISEIEKATTERGEGALGSSGK